MFVAEIPSNFQCFYFASKIFRSLRIIEIIYEIGGLKCMKKIQKYLKII